MKYAADHWKVELHVHLDGSYRPSTVLDVAKRRGIALPHSRSVEEFAEFVRVKKRGTLTDFLANFPTFLQAIKGDREAIRRTAYEFVEDCAKQKIAYVETRFAPHFLAENDVTPEDVVKITLEGLSEASEKFGTKCNVILAGIREQSQWAYETIDLAKKFLGKGVVAIDIAGDENISLHGQPHDDLIRIFDHAKELEIPRTVHAGENGPSESVRSAIFVLGAQRIGHGYRILQDKELYEKVKTMDIHFETCPMSSHLTGGAPEKWSDHPIITFMKDRVNYSINTDDTIITGLSLSEEYELCQREMGLDAAELLRCNFNAAKSAFLPKDEKEELLEHLRKIINSFF